MKRIGAGIAVIVVALRLVTPPAAAQNGSAWLSPRSPEPLESTGEVVLTVSLWRAGRVAYRTYDGACRVTYSRAGTPPDAFCSNTGARAPEDYTATSGELVFTEVEGSRTIKIPIVDDDLAEGDEAFTLAAWEEVNADPWIDRGDSVIVRIIEDDVKGGGAVATTATTAAGSQSSSSAPVVTVPPAPSPLGDLPVPDLAVELASPVLRTGPGFELTSEDSPEPAPGRRGGASGSASSWLAPGLAIAAAGVGAVAFLRRRKKWSPTRS
jgi:hypothetical protein